MNGDEMQKALLADGEKLRQLTGEDHGPQFVCAFCGCLFRPAKPAWACWDCIEDDYYLRKGKEMDHNEMTDAELVESLRRSASIWFKDADLLAMEELIRRFYGVKNVRRRANAPAE
jgi:hypothetical protein